MIPAGRVAITAEQVASLHGYAFRTALNKRLFESPGFPAPLTRGRRKRLYDREQILAKVQGKEIPALPEQPPHDDDLLERSEAADLWGVTRASWDKYMVQGYTPEPDVVIGTVELWRRRTLTSFQRPGMGGGRPEGSRDGAPRARISRSERLSRIRDLLQKAEMAGAEVKVEDVMAAAKVSKSSAYRLLRDVRDLADEHLGAAEP